MMISFPVVFSACVLICLSVICLDVVDAGRCNKIVFCDACTVDQGKNVPICTKCDRFYAVDTVGDRTICTPCSENKGCLDCDTHSRCTICRNRGLDGPDLQGVGSCSPCAPNCRSCSVIGSGKCDICKSGSLKVGDQCEKCTVTNCDICSNNKGRCETCAEGFFYDILSNKCTKCPDNCKQCESTTKCKTCLDNFFREDDGTCNQCTDSNCKQCSDLEQCTTCQIGYYRNTDRNDKKTQCLKCDDSCGTCSSEKVCTQCKHGQGKPTADGSCKCAPNCKSCRRSGNGKCDDCELGYSQTEKKLCQLLQNISG